MKEKQLSRLIDKINRNEIVIHTKIDSVAFSKILEEISKAPHITSLSLTNCQINDSHLEQLADFLSSDEGKDVKINTLGLNFNKITDDGAVQISRILENNTSIKNLFLAGNKFRSAGIETISKALSQNEILESVTLGSNFDRDPETIAAIIIAQNIAANTSLTSLDLGLDYRELVPDIPGITDIIKRNIISKKLLEKYKLPDGDLELTDLEIEFLNNEQKPQDCVDTLNIFYDKVINDDELTYDPETLLGILKLPESLSYAIPTQILVNDCIFSESILTHLNPSPLTAIPGQTERSKLVEKQHQH